MSTLCPQSEKWLELEELEPSISLSLKASNEFVRSLEEVVTDGG